MHIAVSGSIATDHLMEFKGRFADSLIVEQLAKISLSFLVTDLQIRRGGVAANIAFGLGNLGLRPSLVAAAGKDFADYAEWLEGHGVDTGPVWISQTQHTARFICTTDDDQAQLATFYAGAMSESHEVGLGPLHEQRPIDLIVIGASGPEGMTRHTREAREFGIPFAADPSQQLAFADGDLIRDYVDGAAYLFSNDYEAGLIELKTGWSHQEIASRIGTRVTTYGADGVVIEVPGEPGLRVPAVATPDVVDPTGVGDAFRAGFLSGVAWDLSLERSAQVGALLATLVLETVGPQEYTYQPDAMLKRLAEAYGDDAASDVEPHLPAVAD